MAGYPDLSLLNLPENEGGCGNGSSDDSSDEGDMYEEMLGCSYDEYGQLVSSAGNKTHQPEAPQPECPPIPQSTPQPCPQPSTAPRRMSCEGHMVRKKLTLTRDASGRLGIKLKRMGNGIFFSFVEIGSTAAGKGIGFGDQLIGINGVNLPGMTGSSLMQWISQQKATTFKVEVIFRPYDFVLLGELTRKCELLYSTYSGKLLGKVMLDKVCMKGHIKHLQLLEVSGNRVLYKKPEEILQAFKVSASSLCLRVMPRIFAKYLLKGQDKEILAKKLHFSSLTE
ncbi:Syntenin-1 [Clonorchis sinensis]|uniref:Syntenin-1 n=1 Tax=Clonorchis sinensis TaxID=79923 RepID=A0A8T1MJY1_CLOSI|nr:Syntenin-1 [Clonorchis sinensis]